MAIVAESLLRPGHSHPKPYVRIFGLSVLWLLASFVTPVQPSVSSSAIHDVDIASALPEQGPDDLLNSFLIVAQKVESGSPILWPPTIARNLTYCIQENPYLERSHLPDALITLNDAFQADDGTRVEFHGLQSPERIALQVAVNSAVKLWEEAAMVRFHEVDTDDCSSSNPEIWFRIQLVPETSSNLAEAPVFPLMKTWLLGQFGSPTWDEVPSWSVVGKGDQNQTSSQRSRRLRQATLESAVVRVSSELHSDVVKLRNVIAHELGHVLGFYHSHLLQLEDTQIPECRESISTQHTKLVSLSENFVGRNSTSSPIDGAEDRAMPALFEQGKDYINMEGDNLNRPLTPTDPNSIMSYEWCGGTQKRFFSLSPSDKASVSIAYGHPSLSRSMFENIVRDIESSPLTVAGDRVAAELSFDVESGTFVAIDVSVETKKVDDEEDASDRVSRVENTFLMLLEDCQLDPYAFCRRFGFSAKPVSSSSMCLPRSQREGARIVGGALHRHLDEVQTEVQSGSQRRLWLTNTVTETCDCEPTCDCLYDELHISMDYGGNHNDQSSRSLGFTLCKGKKGIPDLKAVWDESFRYLDRTFNLVQGTLTMQEQQVPLKTLEAPNKVIVRFNSSSPEISFRSSMWLQSTRINSTLHRETKAAVVFDNETLALTVSGGLSHSGLLQVLQNTEDRVAADTRQLILRSNGLTQLQSGSRDALLDKFKQVSTMDLSANELTNVSPEWFSGQAPLRVLTLASNHLRDLPSLPTLLSRLDLSHNRFKSFPTCLRALRALKWLDLSHCQVSSLPDWLGKLTELEYLSIRNNRVEVLPSSVGSLLRLRSLDVSENMIKASLGGLSLLSNLETLKITANRLKELDDLRHTSLRVLDVVGNRLSTLPSLPRSVKTLLASDNNIVYPNASLLCFPELSSLDLRNNRVASFSDGHLQNHGSSCTSSLSWLDLSHNSAQELLSTTTADVTFPLLRHLNLRDNRMTSIFFQVARMQNLEHLDASQNEIVDFGRNETLPGSLRYLDLSGNRLQDMTSAFADTMCSAKTVLISNNFLKALPPFAAVDGSGKRKVCNTEMVDVSHNRLTDLTPLANFVQLRTLNAEHNFVTEMPSFAQLWYLSTLRMSHNKIRSLENRQLPYSTEFVDLSFNSLSSFGFRKAFRTLGTARLSVLELDLSFNSISDFDGDFLRSNWTPLRVLNVAGNGMVSFVKEIRALKGNFLSNKLELVDLSNNTLEWRQTSFILETLGLSSVKFVRADNSGLHAPLNSTLVGRRSVVSEVARYSSGQVHLRNYHFGTLPSSLANLTHIKGLIVGNCGIYSLFKSANLTSLTFLSLHHNPLASLPLWVWQSRSIVDLHLPSNKFRNFDLEGGSAFDVALVNQGLGSSLESLSLSHNPLMGWPTIFERARFSKLKELYLRNCGLKHVPALTDALPSLQVLDLAENDLRVLPDVSEHLALRELDASANRIHGAIVGGLPQSMERLSLNQNHITAFDLSPNPLKNMTLLRLSYNQLTSPPKGLPGLTTLTVRRNLLGVIEEGFCDDLKKLKKFEAASNLLQSLPQCLSSMETVQQLRMAQNNFTQLDHLPSNLKVLIANKNHITRFPRFSSNSTLSVLHLGDNMIANVPRSLSLPRLKMLKVDHNRLHDLDVDFRRFEKLIVLSARENHLSSLPESVRDVSDQLRLLDLRNNNLSSFNMSTESILSLLVGGNPLQSLHFGCPKKLARLEMANVSLHELPSCFCDMKKLTYVHMRNNKLKTLPDCFDSQHLRRLYTLDVAFNNLEQLPPSLCQSTLKTMAVNSNPIHTIDAHTALFLSSLRCPPTAEDDPVRPSLLESCLLTREIGRRLYRMARMGSQGAQILNLEFDGGLTGGLRKEASASIVVANRFHAVLEILRDPVQDSRKNIVLRASNLSQRAVPSVVRCICGSRQPVCTSVNGMGFSNTQSGAKSTIMPTNWCDGDPVKEWEVTWMSCASKTSRRGDHRGRRILRIMPSGKLLCTIVGSDPTPGTQPLLEIQF